MSERGVELKTRVLKGTAAVVGALALASCSAETGATHPSTVTVTVTAEKPKPTPTAIETGPCNPFTVYAQFRWPPQGAVERVAPDRASQQIGSYNGGDPIKVDGWRDTGKPTYEKNKPPWNSGVWFHVPRDATTSHPEGWVSFAGVRETRQTKADYDETGLQPYGGEKVILDPACEMPAPKK